MPKQKITMLEALKVIVLTLLVIIAFTSLLASIIGFVFGIIQGQIEIIVGSSIFFLIITLPLSYVVVKYKPIYDDFERKIGYTSPTPKEQIKTFASYAMTFISFFILVYYLNQFLGPFPTELGTELIKDILKIIIEVDGVIIGFTGIIYAELLRFDIPKRKITEGIIISTILFTISIFCSISGMASTYGFIEKNSMELLWRPLNFLLFGLSAFLVFLLRAVRDRP